MLGRSAAIKRGDCTENYKENLKSWARFGLSLSEKDSESWKKLHTKLSKEDLENMLNVLAGFLGATPQGREMLKHWLEKT